MGECFLLAVQGIKCVVLKIMINRMEVVKLKFKGFSVVVGTASCGVAPLETVQERRREVCTRTMHPS